MGEFRKVSTDVQRTINTEIEREDFEKKAKEEEKRLTAKNKKAESKTLAKKSDKEDKEESKEADKAYSSAVAANNQDTDFRESEPAMKDITPEPVADADGETASTSAEEPVLVADAGNSDPKTVVIDTTPEAVASKDQAK